MRERFISRTAELDYFKEQWATRQMSPVSHSSDIWDERAKEWIDALKPNNGKESIRARGMLNRVEATAQYLRNLGKLGPEDSVVDIGCGPGLFVLEFAKTAKLAVGVDYSSRFVEFGKLEAAERRIPNAEFLQRDFFAMDIEAEGMLGAYDLVFSSITPAATGDGCLEKLMSLSRAWCYNASFVYAGDTLSEKVCRDVFDEEFRTRWDGRGFYALLNLLWLLGYYPETTYFDDIRDEIVVPDRRWAERIAAYCNKREEENVNKVQRYLEKLGDTPRQSKFRYGAILWNVNEKDRR